MQLESGGNRGVKSRNLTHNLKAAGSNPAPATNDACDPRSQISPVSPRRPGFFVFAAKLSIAARSPRSTIANRKRPRKAPQAAAGSGAIAQGRSASKSVRSELVPICRTVFQRR